VSGAGAKRRRCPNHRNGYHRSGPDGMGAILPDPALRQRIYLCGLNPRSYSLMRYDDPRHRQIFACGLTRREMLARFANGFGMLGLAGLLAEEASASAPPSLARNERAGKGVGGLGKVRQPMYPAKVKRVIFL